MGYTTTFKGELKFTKELTATQLAKLKTYLGEDCRNHAEWGRTDLSYIDLELLNDFSGLCWDGSEKTYDLEDKINLIIDQMRIEYPDFGLQGKLLAAGEEAEDRWWLIVENGVAIRKDIELTGKKVECPHCGETFIAQD